MEKINQLNQAFNQLAFHHAISTLVYFIISLVLIWISRQVFKRFNSKIDINHELVEKDNVAFAILNVGYFIGVLMCAGATLIGNSNGIITDVLLILAYGMTGILLLNISLVINAKVIYKKLNIFHEVIENKNIGIGIVICSNYVAIGFIILGTLTSESGSIINTLLIWVVGQILLFLATKFYDFITPYKVNLYLLKENIAVGIGYGGSIIAFGNLIYFSIQENFVSYSQYGLNILTYTGIGLVLLPIIRLLTDKILLPNQKLTDELILSLIHI